MNRRQAKWAARNAAHAARLAVEISEAWDQAHYWNARLDEIAALDADWDPNKPAREWASDEEFFAGLD